MPHESDYNAYVGGTRTNDPRRRGGFLSLLGRIGRGLGKVGLGTAKVFASPQFERTLAGVQAAYGYPEPLERLTATEERQYRRGLEKAAGERQARLDEMARQRFEREREFGDIELAEARERRARGFEGELERAKRKRETELEVEKRFGLGPQPKYEIGDEGELLMKRPGEEAFEPAMVKRPRAISPVPPLIGGLFGKQPTEERAPIRPLAKIGTSAEAQRLRAYTRYYISQGYDPVDAAKMASDLLASQSMSRAQARPGVVLGTTDGGETVMIPRVPGRTPPGFIPGGPTRPTAQDRLAAQRAAGIDLVIENPDRRKFWSMANDAPRDRASIDPKLHAEYDAFIKALRARTEEILGKPVETAPKFPREKKPSGGVATPRRINPYLKQPAVR